MGGANGPLMPDEHFVDSTDVSTQQFADLPECEIIPPGELPTRDD